MGEDRKINTFCLKLKCVIYSDVGCAFNWNYIIIQLLVILSLSTLSSPTVHCLFLQHLPTPFNSISYLRQFQWNVSFTVSIEYYSPTWLLHLICLQSSYALNHNEFPRVYNYLLSFISRSLSIVVVLIKNRIK